MCGSLSVLQFLTSALLRMKMGGSSSLTFTKAHFVVRCRWQRLLHLPGCTRPVDPYNIHITQQRHTLTPTAAATQNPQFCVHPFAGCCRCQKLSRPQLHSTVLPNVHCTAAIAAIAAAIHGQPYPLVMVVVGGRSFCQTRPHPLSQPRQFHTVLQTTDTRLSAVCTSYCR